MRWIEHDDPRSSVFWTYRPAGAGKSSIPQSFADLIQPLEGVTEDVSSFSKEDWARKSSTYLQPLPSINIQTQMLIVDPLAKLNGLHIPFLLSSPMTWASAMNVTRNSSSFRTSPRHINFRTSLRFLVSSRPEAHIVKHFTPTSSIPRLVTWSYTNHLTPIIYLSRMDSRVYTNIRNLWQVGKLRPPGSESI